MDYHFPPSVTAKSNNSGSSNGEVIIGKGSPVNNNKMLIMENNPGACSGDGARMDKGGDVHGVTSKRARYLESDLYRLASSALAMSTAGHSSSARFRSDHSAGGAADSPSLLSTAARLSHLNKHNEHNLAMGGVLPPPPPPPSTLLNHPTYPPHYAAYRTERPPPPPLSSVPRNPHLDRSRMFVNDPSPILGVPLRQQQHQAPTIQSHLRSESANLPSSQSNIAHIVPHHRKRGHSEDHADEVSTSPSATISATVVTSTNKNNSSSAPPRSSRMERKRQREMQRRYNVNRELESLSSLVLKINPPEIRDRMKFNAPAASSNNDDNSNEGENNDHKSEESNTQQQQQYSTPLNRVELIHLAVTMLTRLHEESRKKNAKIEELTNTVNSLREANKVTMMFPIMVPSNKAGNNGEPIPQGAIPVAPIIPRDLLNGKPTPFLYNAPPFPPSCYYHNGIVPLGGPATDPSNSAFATLMNNEPHFVFMPKGIKHPNTDSVVDEDENDDDNTSDTATNNNVTTFNSAESIASRHLESLVAAEVAKEVAARTLEIRKAITAVAGENSHSSKRNDHNNRSNHFINIITNNENGRTSPNTR